MPLKDYLSPPCVAMWRSLPRQSTSNSGTAMLGIRLGLCSHLLRKSIFSTTPQHVNPSPFSGSPNNPGPPGRPERPTAPEGRSDGWTHRGQLLQHHTTATPSRTESIPIALHLSEWRREKSRPRACRIHSTSAKVIPRLL